jgi:hypothetical protein
MTIPRRDLLAGTIWTATGVGLSANAARRAQQGMPLPSEPIVEGACAFLSSLRGAERSNLTGFQVVRTENYAVAGDGGGVQYRAVLAEPRHPGKFRSADGQWWEIAARGTVPLAAFGAYGTGADETRQIQAAIDASAALKVPLLAAGATYAFTRLRFPWTFVGLIGVGRERTIFSHLASPEPAFSRAADLRVNFATFSDFTLLGAGVSGEGDGWDMTGFSYCNLERIAIRGFYKDALRAEGYLDQARGKDLSSILNRFWDCIFSTSVTGANIGLGSAAIIRAAGQSYSLGPERSCASSTWHSSAMLKVVT